MNNEEKNWNQIINHRLLNYLNANYQGTFTSLNILSQLKHPDFDQEKLIETQQILKKIKQWLVELKNGTCIFDEKTDEIKLRAQNEIFEILKSLKVELRDTSERLIDTFNQKNFFEDQNKVIDLVANYGRFSYSKDNYIRGFIEFAFLIKDEELISQYEGQLEECSNDTKLAHQFLSLIKRERLQPNFYEHLIFFCRVLPGNFRANIHDINQFLSIKEPDFTFEHTDFSSEEATEWKKAGFGAIEAGYWDAYGMNIEEALIWNEVGFEEPVLASEWRTAQFPPEHAAMWVQFNFTPLLAIQWLNAGYAPVEAAALLDAGFYYPSDLPKGQEKEILNKIMPTTEDNLLEENAPQEIPQVQEQTPDNNPEIEEEKPRSIEDFPVMREAHQTEDKEEKE